VSKKSTLSQGQQYMPCCDTSALVGWFVFAKAIRYYFERKKMIPHYAYDGLLSEFGALIGIPDLSFDQDDLCHLQIDDALWISLRRDLANQRLLLIGNLLEELPDELEPEAVRALLVMAGNPIKGDLPGVALAPDSGMLMMYNSLLMEGLNLAQFERRLEEFIDQLQSWRLMPEVA
jgi:hypothetical protein